MSCFADLGSCQSCKSQEQCKKKGDNLLLSDQYSTIFHPSYIMLDSSPIVPFQVPLVAGDRWGHLSHWPWNHLSRPTRSVSRLPEEPPHPGDGKMLEKIKKVRDHLAVFFQKTSCSWTEIDYIVHHLEHNSRIRSVSVQIGGIGKSYKNPGQTEYFGTLMPIMYIDP